jgi:flagellar basal body-associated protein FliL
VTEAITGARAVVAVICLIVGIVVLLAGVGIGLFLSFRQAAPPAQLDQAKQELDKAEQHVVTARAEIAGLGSRGLEAGGAPDTSKAAAATASAAASTEAAKSAIEQIQGAIASLPENLRFAGLLVLVGAVLMSVATVQFGGTSLF